MRLVVSLFLPVLASASLFVDSGCVTIELVKPEVLLSDTTKDILVTTTSGKLIRMFSEHYHVVRSDSTSAIQGKGFLLKPANRSSDSPFDGIIPFSEIRELETHDKSIFYYSGYYIFVVAATFIVMFIIAFGGRGAGG